MIKKNILFFVVVFLTFMFPVFAVCQSCDHYVTVAGAGNEDGTAWAHAWQGSDGGSAADFHTAIAATTAGETLCIGGGTYVTYNYGGAAWRSQSSGTSGNKITWTASDDGVYGGEVIFDHNGNGNNMPISHNYLIITGTATYTMTHINPLNQNLFATIDVTGDNNELAYGKIYEDSYGGNGTVGIDIDGGSSNKIHNFEMYNIASGDCSVGMGGPIQLLGGATSNEIYDNTLYQSYNGINLAGGTGNDSNLIHDNIIYDMENGGVAADGASASDDNEIYDNTIYDCDVGNINVWHGSSQVGTGWKIYRNLLYFTEARRFMDGFFTDHLDSSKIYNNVIYDGGFNSDGTCGVSNGDFRAFDVRLNADSNEYYNNTIYSTASGATRAFWFWDDASNVVKNNVVYMTSSNAGAYVVYYEDGEGNTDSYANNVYYAPNVSGSDPYYVDSAARNFTYWDGLSWVDDHAEENPDFDSTSNLPTAAARTNDGLVPDNDASSPLIDNGADLSGTFTLDFLENARDASFDMGAYEYSASGDSISHSGVSVN